MDSLASFHLPVREECAILNCDGGYMMSRTAESSNQPIPKSYWQDQDWAFDHYPELVKRYGDRWVAVVNKRVVAASKSSVKAEKQARAKTPVKAKMAAAIGSISLRKRAGS